MSSDTLDDPYTADGRGTDVVGAAAFVVPGPLDGAQPALVAVESDRDAAWVRPALLLVLLLTAVLDLWSLSSSGYANTYYTAAAQAASQDWRAFFFGSLDAGNFITIDKPPLSIWAMGLSVRLLGLNSLAILLPQALMGVATVGVLFAAVRRSFGDAAGVLAALVMALTPVAVLIFRFNNPDALLTLLLVLAAWALLRGLADTRLRWVVLASMFVGLAFTTKYLQAYLVLPAFAITYLLGAAGGARHRFVGLLTAAVSVFLASAWWVAIVQALPLGSRPWIGGSTDGGALDVLFGYDGLGRIFGEGLRPGGGAGASGLPGPGFGFGGAPGPLRLFNERWGGQIAWLLPFAGISAVAGLWLRRAAPRTDAARSGYLLWGLWGLVHVLVFSLMTGIVHTYYAVAAAPAVAALVGAGMIELWRWRRRSVAGGVVLAAAVLLSAAWAAVLLDRSADFLPGLAIGIVSLGVAMAAVLVVPARLLPARLTALALGGVLLVVLAGPAAFSIETVARGYGGGDPRAGPATGFDFGAFGAAGPGGFGGFGGGSIGVPGSGAPGGPGGGSSGGPGGSPGGPGSPGANPGRTNRASSLVAYLVAHQGEATWIVATSGSMSAANIQLASGKPVMAMGGFTGGDPTPTLDQLQALIRAGKLRFVMVGGAGFGGFLGGPQVGRARDSWVTSTCARVQDVADGSGPFAAGLYDCVG